MKTITLIRPIDTSDHVTLLVTSSNVSVILEKLFIPKHAYMKIPHSFSLNRHFLLLFFFLLVSQGKSTTSTLEHEFGRFSAMRSSVNDITDLISMVIIL